MSDDQRVEQGWETPSHDEIVALTRQHVDAMGMTDDDVVWVQAGMHHVLLQTIGRRSGKLHKVALPTWRDPGGHRIVVASFAGAPAPPSWFFNLCDRDVNPRVHCRVQHGEYWSVPEVLASGGQRDRLWEMLVADRAWYADYQARTDRTIALVRLPETDLI